MTFRKNVLPKFVDEMETDPKSPLLSTLKLFCETLFPGKEFNFIQAPYKTFEMNIERDNYLFGYRPDPTGHPKRIQVGEIQISIDRTLLDFKVMESAGNPEPIGWNYKLIHHEFPAYITTKAYSVLESMGAFDSVSLKKFDEWVEFQKQNVSKKTALQ